MAVKAATRVAIATAYLVVHGCDPVNGGAVELSWKLRPASGFELPDDEKFLVCCDPAVEECTDPEEVPVTAIRLDWCVNCGEDDEVSGYGAWPCENNHGVTGFDLPEGNALLRVSPVCIAGIASPTTYTAPAPVQRPVVTGDTIALGAIELILQVSDCLPPLRPCICQAVLP